MGRIDKNLKPTRGQALIMVTFALIAMLGLIGLLIDLGWGFYLEKKYQGVADTAALASVQWAIDNLGTTVPTAVCGSNNIVCTGVGTVTCPGPGGNLAAACAYAAANLDETGVTVTLQASDADTVPPTVIGCTPNVNHPPTAPCVDVNYWVTVRVARDVPQLFSRVFGNETGLVSSRATAAIAKGTSKAGLYLMNRNFDPFILGSGPSGDYTGTNLATTGNPQIIVPNGIVMASSTDHAGELTGDSAVIASATMIRGAGDFDTTGNSWEWDRIGTDLDGDGYYDEGNDIQETEGAPHNLPDGDIFIDPLSGRGQPTIPQAVLDNLQRIEVPNGELNATVCPSNICAPGFYYATEPWTVDPDRWVPSGGRISITGQTLTMGNGGTAALDSFVFYGGMDIASGAAAEVTFEPGIYMMAGVLDQGDAVLETHTNARLYGGNTDIDATPAQRDLGRMFILTDDRYAPTAPEAATHQLDTIVGKVSEYYTDVFLPGLPDLHFGGTKIKGGANAGTEILLQGLNREAPNLPAELEKFSPVVIWQDQRNSYYRYDDYGNYGCVDIDPNCAQLADGRAPEMPLLEFDAGTNVTLWGAVYQPRGAYASLQGGPSDAGPIQIITGALEAHGNGTVTLVGPELPIFDYITALVE